MDFCNLPPMRAIEGCRGRNGTLVGSSSIPIPLCAGYIRQCDGIWFH